MIDLATLLFIAAGFCWGFGVGYFVGLRRTRRAWLAAYDRLSAQRAAPPAPVAAGAPEWDQPTLDREEAA